MSFTDIRFEGESLYSTTVKHTIWSYKKFLKQVVRLITQKSENFEFLFNFFAVNTSFNQGLTVVLENNKTFIGMQSEWTEDLSSLYDDMYIFVSTTSPNGYSDMRGYLLEIITEFFLEKKHNVSRSDFKIFHEPKIFLGEDEFFPSDKSWRNALIDFCYIDKGIFLAELCDAKASLSSFLSRGGHDSNKFNKIFQMKYFKNEVEKEPNVKVCLSLCTFEINETTASAYPLDDYFELYTCDKLLGVLFP